jgi:hypothetical protein
MKRRAVRTMTTTHDLLYLLLTLASMAGQKKKNQRKKLYKPPAHV